MSSFLNSLQGEGGKEGEGEEKGLLSKSIRKDDRRSVISESGREKGGEGHRNSRLPLSASIGKRETRTQREEHGPETPLYIVDKRKGGEGGKKRCIFSLSLPLIWTEVERRE